MARVTHREWAFIQHRGWDLGPSARGLGVYHCAALQGCARDSRSGPRTSDFGSGGGVAGCIRTIRLCVFIGVCILPAKRCNFALVLRRVVDKQSVPETPPGEPSRVASVCDSGGAPSLKMGAEHKQPPPPWCGDVPPNPPGPPTGWLPGVQVFRVGEWGLMFAAGSSRLRTGPWGSTEGILLHE